MKKIMILSAILFCVCIVGVNPSYAGLDVSETSPGTYTWFYTGVPHANDYHIRSDGLYGPTPSGWSPDPSDADGDPTTDDWYWSDPGDFDLNGMGGTISYASYTPYIRITQNGETIAENPEPATMAIFGLGGLGLAVRRKFLRKA